MELLRVGIVTNVDELNGLVQVYFEETDSSSDMIPCLCTPERVKIGNTVLVGRLCTKDSIVLGCLWKDDNNV